MRTLFLLCIVAFLTACASTPRTSGPPSAVSEKVLATFPKGANVYWVPSQGDFADAGQIARVATFPNQSVRDVQSILATGKSADVQLAVSGPNSALARHIVAAALKETEGALPRLQLLFIGREDDASALRPLVEAKGGRFYFQQWP